MASIYNYINYCVSIKGTGVAVQ